MQTHSEAQSRERFALRLSGGIGLALAVLGVGWGFAASSAVILFDGLYSILGFLMSWIGLRAAALIDAGPTPRYPFGREALAPLVVGVQALVLLGTFGYASLDAVGVILAGGGDTEVGSALVYSVLSLLAVVGAVVVLSRMDIDSDLVAAEVAQWRAAMVLGVLLVVGFGIAVGLKRSAFADLAPFVDPVLVLVAAVVILPTPIGMLRQAFRELLEGVPLPEVTDPIDAAIELVRTTHGLPQPQARIGKLGRKVYIELDFLVAEEQGWTVDEADQVRRELITELNKPGQTLWVNVELHTDPDWDTDLATP